jgi:hypothetical protein
VHDTVAFEIRGIPSVFVASHVSQEAAQTQAAALGLPEVRRVFVPHPIQDANDDEMRARADAIIEKLIEALVD